MEKDSMLLRDLPDFFDRFDGPDLIIGKHYRQKDRIRTDRLFYLLRIHKSKFVHRQIRHLKAPLFQILSRMQDRVMLDPGRNDVLSFGRVRLGRRHQRPVIGLASAAGKINLIVLCSQRSRDHCSRMGHCLFARIGKPVHRRWISIMLRIKRQHRFHDLGTNLRRSRVVKIDYLLHKSAFL